MDDDEIDVLGILELGNPGFAPSIRQARKAASVVDAFCVSNGRERPRINVTAVRSEEAGGRYDPVRKELRVFLTEGDAFEFLEMRPDDGSPYSVTLHELGHWVHHEWFDCEDLPEGERQLSEHDTDGGERFAETFRVFADNPNNLKAWNPTRYDWMVARIRLPDVSWPEASELDFEPVLCEEQKEAFKNLNAPERSALWDLLKRKGLVSEDVARVVSAFGEARGAGCEKKEKNK